MVKNLVFDVGNVLIGFRTFEMLSEHGLDEQRIRRFVSCVFEDPLWKQVDLGIMPFDELVREYCRRTPDLEADILWLIDNADQMQVGRPRVWERVRRLKEKGFGIYILSNYGSYFYEKQFKHAPFMEWTDGAVISWQVNVIKPDPAIYQELLKRYGLAPADCIFFDDMEANIKTAGELGFGTCLVTSEEMLLEKLDALLVLCEGKEIVK